MDIIEEYKKLIEIVERSIRNVAPNHEWSRTYIKETREYLEQGKEAIKAYDDKNPNEIALSALGIAATLIPLISIHPEIFEHSYNTVRGSLFDIANLTRKGS